jgi:hypothetical protein
LTSRPGRLKAESEMIATQKALGLLGELWRKDDTPGKK